ncbi:hypothetical protein DOM21_14235 [Bacteriovorax stolpii]|uniref:Uncharacterized protein n=1 Tax=Bacteriovorax stolpii TaxID=960 RepID=A0A2K9NPJ2_BACTC|nr:hypothetical protein [Bacteriovorax stolpii]AUN97441.1 hypothetical protein C0V70_04820 [Bacteriovorax stolpii]QDK42588.1 hypothetical protein DOM21_14235 [Bacteriovorax stolpii]TDP52618.1 hypothetical protein C8D79_2384 [Bacteriovorax stolpii]
MDTLQRFHSDDPKEQALNIAQSIYELKRYCHDESVHVKDPKAQALFETTAEVLAGLEKAFSDFQSENVGGWVNDENRPTPM